MFWKCSSEDLRDCVQLLPALELTTNMLVFPPGCVYTLCVYIYKYDRILCLNDENEQFSKQIFTLFLLSSTEDLSEIIRNDMIYVLFKLVLFPLRAGAQSGMELVMLFLSLSLWMRRVFVWTEIRSRIKEWVCLSALLMVMTTTKFVVHNHSVHILYWAQSVHNSVSMSVADIKNDINTNSGREISQALLTENREHLLNRVECECHCLNLVFVEFATACNALVRLLSHCVQCVHHPKIYQFVWQLWHLIAIQPTVLCEFRDRFFSPSIWCCFCLLLRCFFLILVLLHTLTVVI